MRLFFSILFPISFLILHSESWPALSAKHNNNNLKIKKVMQRILTIKAVGDVRTFEAQSRLGGTETIKSVGVEFTDGFNEMYAEGYRDVVDKIVEMKPQPGDIVHVKLSTSIRRFTKDDKEYLSTSVNIVNIYSLVKNSF